MAFRELLGEGYVEIAARGVQRFEEDLSRVEARTKRTQASMVNLHGVGMKLFLAGFGFASAESIIQRVGGSIQSLIMHMHNAAMKGQSVGDAIARWAKELTGVDNAVTRLEARMASERKGQVIGAATDERIQELLGIKLDSAGMQMRASEAERNRLARDISEAKAGGGYREALKGLLSTFGPLGIAAASQIDPDIKSMELDLKQKDNSIRQKEELLRKAEAEHAERTVEVEKEVARREAKPFGFTNPTGFAQMLQQAASPREKRMEDIAQKSLAELKQINANAKQKQTAGGVFV